MSIKGKFLSATVALSLFVLSSGCNNPVPPSNQSGVTYTITESGANVVASPSSPQTVAAGASETFTVAPATGYTLSSTVGGTCASGSWNGSDYTTGATTADCTVIFSATINSYSVTVSGSNVTFSPSVAQQVNYGGTQSYTVTASTGYTLSQAVAGTCANGSWNGSVYTTGAITDNCTVIFGTTIDSFSVTPSGTNVTFTPNGAQSVQFGAAQTFTVTANTGYTLSKTPGGTCPTGSWNGNVYTTGAIAANCTVAFSAAISTYTVTASGTNLSVSPGSASVTYNKTQAFTVTPAVGYNLSTSTGGSCPKGSWDATGRIYTTGLIKGNCSVLFKSTIITLAVQVTGPNLNIIEDGTATGSSVPGVVNYGRKMGLAVTPKAGFDASPTVGGTCPIGGWDNGYPTRYYTSGAITSNCTIILSAVTIPVQAVWANLDNPDFLVGITTDSAGNVYAVGSANGNSATLRKMDSSGAVLWGYSVALSGPDPGAFFSKVAVDAQGNIYVVGYVSGYDASNLVDFGNGITLSIPPNAGSALIAKFNSKGVVQWASLFPDAGQSAIYGSIAIDNKAGVVYAGAIEPQGMVVKYTFAGVQTWEQPDISPVASLAVDSMSNLYLANSANTLRKFSPSGIRLWSKTLVGSTSDGIAIDSNDNVFVAGASASGQVQLTKLSSDGTQQWIQSINAAFNFETMALDHEGNAYLSGNESVNLNDSTAVLMKYSNDGTLQWVQSPTGTYLSFLGLAVDGSNNIYCVGQVVATGFGSGQPSTVDFGNSVTATLPGSQNASAVIVRYH